MKKIITWVTLFLMSMVTTAVYAQQVPSDSILHVVAVQALKENKFVLEADRLMFKRGDVAYVNSNTNFVLVDGEKGTVQVAFNNTPFAGPNGIGGVTVDGKVSGVRVKESKKGSVTYSFSVQGAGISAQVGHGQCQSEFQFEQSYVERPDYSVGGVYRLQGPFLLIVPYMFRK